MAHTYAGQLPIELPPLIVAGPLRGAGVLEVFNEMQVSYSRGLEVARLDEANMARINAAIEQITNVNVPQLRALNKAGSVDVDWLEQVTSLFTRLMQSLLTAKELAEAGSQSTLRKMELVSVVHDGGRGKPKIVVDRVYLEKVFDGTKRISKSEVAAALGIGRKTLDRNLAEYGIIVEYMTLTQEELEREVEAFTQECPDQGYHVLDGYLLAQGKRLRMNDVKRALNPIGRVQRRLQNKRHRRPYFIPGSNAVWHMDGHHKLIRWKIIIHGCIDGYCRTVVGLHASDNNKAGTVREMIRKSVREYGCPSRIRGDRGGENQDVARFMILARGAKRGSFLWGKSTGNSPIERLWGALGEVCVRRWRAFFTRLEEEHFLNASDDAHIWLLHRLFMDLLNEDLVAFVQQWNHHGVSSARMKNKSPEAARLLSLATFGERIPPAGEVLREVMELYHGMDMQDDAEVTLDDLDNLVLQIGLDQDGSIRHEGVECASPRCPFPNEDGVNSFCDRLEAITAREEIPAGFGLQPLELGPKGYSETFVLRVGRRGGKEHPQVLPAEVWYPRACQESHHS